MHISVSGSLLTQNIVRNKIVEKLHNILSAYGLLDESSEIEDFGTGLINHTWKIKSGGESFILQKVNSTVFKEPADIAYNIRLVADHLEKHHPEYRFVAPRKTLKGEELVYWADQGYYRLFPFVSGSHSKDVVGAPEQAFEAAKQFGRFTRLLHGLDTGQLRITIPCFHDLGLRYEQFLRALANGNQQRVNESSNLVSFMISNADIVSEYRNIKTNPEFKLRVTHHDTKISNVLFDDHGNGICVIDLDTVMPGYFISDLGDMMRTYLSPVSEEENDTARIYIREDFYKAIVQGYYNEMKDELTSIEKKYFFYAGTFMIYMQALRFLTDFLNNDVYYGAKYPRHNLVRARNQMVLLKRMMEKKDLLERSIEL